jgi:hypothetical protein
MATNIVSGKRYIGQSICKLNRRKSSHKCSCFTQKKKTILNDAIRSYGWDKFIWKVILTCENKELDYYETELIAAYKLTDRQYGYNEEGGGNRGKYRPSAKWSGEKNGMFGKKCNSNQKRGLLLGHKWQRDNKKIVSEQVKKRWADPKFRERMKDRKSKPCKKWVVYLGSERIEIYDLGKYCFERGLNKTMFYHLKYGNIKKYREYSL